MREVLNCHRPEVKDEDEEIVYWLNKAGIPEPEPAMTLRPGGADYMTRLRAAIATAFSTFPQLVIMDEPTAGLDQSNQDAVLDLLGRMRDQTGMATLLGTRDLRVACRMAGNLAIMGGGGIVEAGVAEEILHNPSHDKTKELIALTPGVEE